MDNRPAHRKMLFFLSFSCLLLAFNSATAEEVASDSDIASPAPSPSISSAIEIYPRIMKICESTDHVDVCLDQVSSSIQGGDPGDVRTVLEAAIRSGSDLAKGALDSADNNMGMMSELSDDSASNLKDCKSSYEDASDNFEKAMEAFAAGDIGTMNTMLSAIITDANDCMDLFGDESSPMAEISDKLSMMASNCLALTAMQPGVTILPGNR